MDTILNASYILDERNWIFSKLYKDPNSPSNWKPNLDWYHQTLINVVRPIVLSMPEIRVVFFGMYGPTTYSAEGETYERQRRLSGNNLVFIRLRFGVAKGGKTNTKNALLAAIAQNTNLVWEHEVMRTYRVMNDLGSRYGSNTNAQTLQFIRYWDAACRYILSILTSPGNWISDVDVWGIPHLVNNSLGAWLRPERGPVPCPRCHSHMYMATCSCSFSPTRQIGTAPYFLFICPSCNRKYFHPMNI